MDGLLFNSEALYRDAFLATAGTMEHAFTAEHFLPLVGNPWATNRIILQEHLGQTGDPATFRTVWIPCYGRMKGAVALKPGALELLDLLDHLDQLELLRSICTSSGHEDVQSNLAAHNLRHRFNAVVAFGDYGRGKPYPDPYLKTAERLGVTPSDCLALEDPNNGVRAAVAAGMRRVMVPDLLPATDEIRPLCHFVANKLHSVSSDIFHPEWHHSHLNT